MPCCHSVGQCVLKINILHEIMSLATWQPGNLAYLLRSDKGAGMFQLRKLFAYGSFDQLTPIKLISIKIASCIV